MAAPKRKIYQAVDSCKKVLKSFEVQGYENVIFSALFYRGGKKLNSIEGADTQYFSKLILNYEKTENPDKVKIEFKNGDSESLLWSKEYNVSEAGVEPVSMANGFQGFGEAEINDIVQRKLSDYEKIKEAEELREQLEELTAENDELRGSLEEATDQLYAKKQIEYYANLLGMAMPGLAKVLGKSQAGQALGFLSGTDDEPQQIESLNANSKKTDDSQTVIIQMIDEYMHSLDTVSLGKLYLIMCEFSSNSALINKTLELLTTKE